MQGACIILKPYPYPATHSMEQLSSMKLVSGAKNVGDRGPKILETKHLCPHFDINLVRPVLDF